MRAFVSSLEPAERGRLETRLKMLALDGLNAGTHMVRAVLGGGRGVGRGKLWELRMPKSQNNPRVLFCLISEHRILLLHGFKKTGQANDKLPEREVAVALKRRDEFLERQGRK